MQKFCEMSDSDLISSLSYFDALTPEVKQAITQRWVRISGWREGRLLYDFGERPNRVYVVVSGVVEVMKQDGLNWYLGAGSILGDEAMIGGSPHKSAAIARTPCNLLVMDEWFRLLAEKAIGVQRNVINTAQARDTEQDIYSCQMLRSSKPGRVVLALLNIAEAVDPRIVEDDAARFPFEVEWWDTQQKIGELVSVSRPKVREALNLLMSTDIIDTDWETDETITLPPVLMEDSINGLRQLLRHIL